MSADLRPEFIDPRIYPDPPCRVRTREPAESTEELRELSELCSKGRVYAVEAWIRDGRPIHAGPAVQRGGRRTRSALEVALETSQLDLALLLLCNGFPPDPEGGSLLDVAVAQRKLAFVDLLLNWGADPQLVDAYNVLDTYDVDLYESFWNRGLDFTAGHALARMLADHSSNRPGYGWARRHNTDPKIARELSIALLQAAVENRERAVGLLMWAGADPRRPVPDIRYSSGEEMDDDDEPSNPMIYALIYGHGHLLKFMKPDSARDNLDELWASACDEGAVDYLAKAGKPADWSQTLRRNLEHSLWSYRRDSSRKIVERLTVEHDARLTTMSDDAIKGFRRELLRCEDESRCRWVLRWMSYPETCEPALFAELTRTPAMQRKVNSLHIRDARYAR